MQFSEIILEKLDFIIEKYSLKILEQRKDYLKLICNQLTITISHNNLENSNLLWLGRQGKFDSVEVNNQALKDFFYSDLKLENIPFEIFINNLVVFFDNEARSLFEGDEKKLNELLKYNADRSHEYTQDLLDGQILTKANNAWDSSNYKEFVKLINQINKDKLPASYHLKLKIAYEKI